MERSWKEHALLAKNLEILKPKATLYKLHTVHVRKKEKKKNTKQQ